MTEIALRNGLADAKTLWLIIGTAIGAKDQIHQWRQIRIVSGVAIAIVMPMVKFGAPINSAAGRSAGEHSNGCRSPTGHGTQSARRASPAETPARMAAG